MKIIGLTGGSGSGKSTVAILLSQIAHVYIVDADQIGHEIILKGKPAYYSIIESFGKDILKEDGEINRKKLGQIVFNDKCLLNTLNNIMHPLIKKEIMNIIKGIKNSGGSYHYIIIDAALLIESKLHIIVDEVWIVYAREDIRIKRIANRDNITESQAKKRIDSQMSWEKMKKYGDVIIDNGKNKEFTIEQLNIIINNRSI